MTNEEQILQLLHSHTEMFGSIQTRLDGIDARLDRIEVDIEEIKEDAAVTRVATNMLVDWAERAEKVYNVPLMAEV